MQTLLTCPFYEGASKTTIQFLRLNFASKRQIFIPPETFVSFFFNLAFLMKSIIFQKIGFVKSVAF